MIDIQEKNVKLEQLDKINKHLPKECINCPHLEVINLSRMEVRCFYRPRNECILK